MDQRYEGNESTILSDRQKRNRPSCQSVLGPQWSYIKRLTRGIGPKVRDDIWLRKTGFDVLTNIETIEKGLQRTNELFKRSVNHGKRATEPRAI